MILASYVLLGLAIIKVEVSRIRQRRPPDALVLFNIIYFVFFVFVPLNVMLLGEVAVRQKYVYQQFGYGDESTAISFLVCYLLFAAGFFLKRPVAQKYATQNVDSLRLSDKKDYASHFYNIARRISIAFLLIGSVGLIYHTALMGGPVKSITLAPLVRTGTLSLKGKWLFLRQFSTFVSTALVLFWAVYDSKRKVLLCDTLLMVSLISLHVYYALITNGRRVFWFPVIICFLVSLMAGNGFKFRQAILFAFCLFLWFIPGTLDFFKAFAPVANTPVANTPVANTPVANALIVITYYFKNLYLNTLQGLADTFMHFVGLQHARLWQFGFLRDIAEIPLQFVPSKLFGFNRGRGFFGDITDFLVGHPLGQGSVCEEPPGLPGYLLINFGYFGMFVLFFLLGVAYKLLDKVSRPARRNEIVDWLIYFWLLFMFLGFFREGVLIFELKQRASWWLAIGLLILAKRSAQQKLTSAST